MFYGISGIRLEDNVLVSSLQQLFFSLRKEYTYTYIYIYSQSCLHTDAYTPVYLRTLIYKKSIIFFSVLLYCALNLLQRDWNVYEKEEFIRNMKNSLLIVVKNHALEHKCYTYGYFY